MSPTATVRIKPAIAKSISDILAMSGPCPDAGEDEVLYRATANFPDGSLAEIKLCNGNTPWVDSVLFTRGGNSGALHEAAVLEPGENFLGEHIFRVGRKSYTVNVQTKKDGRKGRRARPPKRGSP